MKTDIYRGESIPGHNEEEGGRKNGQIHCRVSSGRGSTRGQSRGAIHLRLQLFQGHPSSTSPSPGPSIWKQSDSDTDWGSQSNRAIVKPSDNTVPVPQVTTWGSLSRIGSGQEPITPPNSPTWPGPFIRQGMALWEINPLGNNERLSGNYVPERELDKVESPRSPRFPQTLQQSRLPTPQSTALRPTPAVWLKGGFAGVETEIWEVVSISNAWKAHQQSCLHP